MTDISSFDNCKAEFHTLGCKLNFAETSTIARIFAERGIRRAQPGEVPDICVVNTCSVTELADKKCRQTIRRLANRYPDAVIVVTGCYAQLKKDEVAAIDGVDIVLGSEQKMEISAYLDRWLATRKPQVEVTPAKDIRAFSPSCSRGDRTRYFLKVQDGCDYFCSYCTIPFARGRSRSGSIESLVAQAREVVAEGGKEIVITGVNIGDFGKNTGESFIDLVRTLDAVEGIERYRISSIEPDLLTDEIIDFCARSRTFMPHFHIPLQCGSDTVLRLMRRHYDSALFAHKVEMIKRLIPDAFIGVDLMVGTRGETEELFEESMRFVDGLDITRLHVFPYSERPGTLALRTIDHVVDQHTKSVRAGVMIALSDRKLRAFMQRYAGTVRPVLFEQPQPGMPMHGFTDNYIRVEVSNAPEALVNTVAQVRLLSISPDDPDTMLGEVVTQQ
ncbi:MAG: tRNA (N(6)-L-threonylcarbamoyladenosine(37)-C(2))-methylthiotransferase MtaB [Muribaculaceae bacterium]|nr:tRNA (N(6)-L-threonylcarbamoyladenosine(37)-C(2))-methylthiotransferase MtaB [Muribaculaceae bacterium]